MHAAAVTEGEVICERLLANGASINRYNKNRETALHLAISCHKAKDVCELLLKNGVSTNISNAKNETPLHIAAESNKNEVCKLLISYGASVNAVNAKHETPLNIAARNGSIELCQILIDSGGDTYYHKTKKQKILLDIPQEDWSLQLYKNLMENGIFGVNMEHCNVKTWKKYFLSYNLKSDIGLISNKSDSTCLHMAILKSNLRLCQRLLQERTENKMQNVNESFVCSKNHYICCRFSLGKRGYVYDRNNNNTGVQVTAKGMPYGNCKTFTEETVADFDGPSDLKWNAFHFAALVGNYEILRLLFQERVAGRFEKNSDNQICLHIAALNGRVDISKFLIEVYNFNLNVTDEREWSPLRCSAYSGNYKLFQYLLDKGGDPFKIAKDGNNCFHIACYCGHLRICELILFRHPPNGPSSRILNSTNRDGNTCLHISALAGHVNICKLLLAYDVDITKKNNDEETVQDIATRNDQEDLSAILKEKLHLAGE